MLTRRDLGLSSVALVLPLLIVQAMVLTACTNAVPATEQQVGQASNVDIGLMARLHFNTQTSDFVRSRAF